MAGYTIPNRPDAGYADQSEPDAVDFELVSDQRFGVISGGVVTQLGSPAMSVTVTAVTAVVNGEVVSNGGGTVSITAAGANPRFDLITIDNGGTLGKITGDSTTTNPRFPVWDRATTTVLAAVYVPNGATSITNSMIVDKRVMFEVSFKRRQVNATDTVLDVGDTATGSRFRLNASGKLTWEGGASDLTLSHDTVSDKMLQLVGSLVAQAVDTATATLTLKAITSQTANLLEIRNASNVLVGSVDVNGNATWGSALISGSGSPEGVQTAAVGTLYRQTDSNATVNQSHLWVKETGSGNTGWVALMEYNPPLLTIPVGLMMPWPSTGAAPTNFLVCDGTAVSRTTYAALFAVIGTSWGAGDGSTTFNLPDFRERVPVGKSASDGTMNTIGQTGGAKTHTLSASEMPSHTHSIAHDHTAFSSGVGGAHNHSFSDPGHFHYFSNVSLYPSMGGYVVRHTTVVGGTWWASPEGAGGKPGGALQIYYVEGGSLYTQASGTGASISSVGDHTHTIDVPSFSGNSGSAGSGSAHQNMPPYGVVTWLIKAA